MAGVHGSRTHRAVPGTPPLVLKTRGPTGTPPLPRCAWYARYVIAHRGGIPIPFAGGGDEEEGIALRQLWHDERSGQALLPMASPVRGRDGAHARGRWTRCPRRCLPIALQATLQRRYRRPGGPDRRGPGRSRAVFDELRTMHPPCPVARTGLVMATVLDPSLPEVASAAVEARALFEHLEAQVWLDRLDEALARSDAVPPVQASPGHRSAASTASPPVS